MTQYSTPETPEAAIESFFELFPLLRGLANDDSYPLEVVQNALGTFILSAVERMMKQYPALSREGNLTFELGILTIFSAEVTNHLPRESIIPFITTFEAKCRKYIVVEGITKH